MSPKFEAQAKLKILSLQIAQVLSALPILGQFTREESRVAFDAMVDAHSAINRIVEIVASIDTNQTNEVTE